MNYLRVLASDNKPVANETITKEKPHLVEAKSRARSSTLGKEGKHHCAPGWREMLEMTAG